MRLSLAQRDQACIWHPFTQMKTAGLARPLVRGQGAVLYDEDQRPYLDGISSWWTNLHGHAHPYLAERLAEQAKTLAHVIFADFTHPPAIELAERILGHLPQQQKRVFFSDNGSTAVEVALKMTMQYHYNLGHRERRRIIALEGAYHGDTFGAMSVGDRSSFSAPFEPYLFEVAFIPAPLPSNEAQSLAALQAILDQGQAAALILEPLVQGSGGMRMYRPEILAQMFQACRQAQCLIIADEVMTGFGRTGRFWACSHQDQEPDMFCLSKGLTGGNMPLSLTTCTEAIFQAFWSDDKLKALFHGHSFTANPLACVTALASLDLMEQDQTWTQIAWLEQEHAAFVAYLQKNYPEQVSWPRHQGTILAFELQTPQYPTGYFNPVRDKIWQFFLERGLLLRPLGNTVYLMPPYCLSPSQLARLYQGIEDLIQASKDF